MILIISSKSSFEMNKVNPYPAFTVPFPLIFNSNLSNTDEVVLVACLGKENLVKKTAKSNNALLAELLIILPKLLQRVPTD